MHCPSLTELPPPPEGKTGWPWTVETPPLPPTRPDGSPWPRISIVTPSYNQGQYIEETIRSVLLQGYPDLEYIIIDGSSTDGSVEIIRKYERWLTYWVSEKDRGQVEALTKGFAHVSGKYLNWINSDDYLLPNALEAVSSIAFAATNPDLVSGARLQHIDGALRLCQNTWQEMWPFYLAGFPDFPQEATFFSDIVWQNVSGFDGNLNYIFDVAFYYKALNFSKSVALTSAPLSVMHVYGEQKTNRADEKKKGERALLAEQYMPTAVRSRLIARLARTRFHRLIRLLCLLLFRDRRTLLHRVEYDFSTSSWQRSAMFDVE